MDDSTPWPIREAERLWRFISDSVGRDVEDKGLSIGIANWSGVERILSFENEDVVVDADWVSVFVNTSQHHDDPGYRFRAHQALFSAFLFLCLTRANGRERLHPADFHETDRPLGDWWNRVQSGEFEVPRKPRGRDPRVNFPEDVLIQMMLEALQAEGINATKTDGTKNDALHDCETGCELIARHWKPKTRPILKPGGVASVVQGFSGIRRPRKR